MLTSATRKTPHCSFETLKATGITQSPATSPCSASKRKSTGTLPPSKTSKVGMSPRSRNGTKKASCSKTKSKAKRSGSASRIRPMFRRRKLSWVSSLETISEATVGEENKDQAPMMEASSEQPMITDRQLFYDHFMKKGTIKKETKDKRNNIE